MSIHCYQQGASIHQCQDGLSSPCLHPKFLRMVNCNIRIMNFAVLEQARVLQFV
uniref:N-acetyltransferase n=1 Tax=Rhizophora mucronata TaxID=61149 RepID=A0A2P2KE91_RHIMU